MYAQKRDTGLNMKDLAFTYVKGDMLKNYQLIKNELLNTGAATEVTRTNSPITDVWTADNTYQWSGKDPQKNDIFIRYVIDNDFTRTMQIQVVAGRDVNSLLYPGDSSAVLLTEAAVKQMNLKNPIGETIKSSQGTGTWNVVGVIKDFIPGIPYESIKPIILHGPVRIDGATGVYGAITWRLNPHNTWRSNIDKATLAFKKYNPDYTLEHHMVADAYADRFSDVKSMGKLASIFAGLTILISCLGLFALAAYMAESKVKEIGVRKVLGASVAAIVTLLSSGFLKLICIAFLIASPIAWYTMHSWLQHFEYRVDITWWIFALTGVMSILLTVLTIGYQAIKAAMSNPIKALRSE